MLTEEVLSGGWLVPAAVVLSILLLVLRGALRRRRTEPDDDEEAHPLPALPPLARATPSPASFEASPPTPAPLPSPGAPLVAVSGATAVDAIAPSGSLLAALGLPESLAPDELPSQSRLPALEDTGRHSPFEPTDSRSLVAARPARPPAAPVEPPPPPREEADQPPTEGPEPAWEPPLPPLRGGLLVGAGGLDARLARAGFQHRSARLAYGLLLLGCGLIGGEAWHGADLGFPPALDAALTVAAFGLATLAPSLWLDLRGLRGTRRLRDALADSLDLAALLHEGGEDGRSALLRVQRLGGPVGVALRLCLPRLTTRAAREQEAEDAAARWGLDGLGELLRSAWHPDGAERCRRAAARTRVEADRDVEAWARRTPLAAAFTLLVFVLPAVAVLLLGPAILDLVHRLLPALGI